MIRCIVAGTDDSTGARSAVREAVTLARELDADLHLVGSSGRLPAWLLAETSALETAAEAWADGEARLRESLCDAAAGLAAQGLRVRAHVASGEPAEVIVSVARSVGADLIVVGDRGMRGLGRVFGSVPRRVSHQAHCGVLIVRTS